MKSRRPVYKEVRRKIKKQGIRRKQGIREVRVNRRIKAREVRVIDPEGKQLGIMSFDDAFNMAMEMDLDLVEVADKSDPPVCRIMDYGKFKYQQSKKSQESRKKQVIIHLKEIKLRPKTDEHDFQFKVRHMERFLKEGNKVKVSMIFRGREIMHPDIGEKILMRVIDFIKEWGAVEQAPKREGRAMFMVLAPIQSPKGQSSGD
jgi:translation initiation factor IF-3